MFTFLKNCLFSRMAVSFFILICNEEDSLLLHIFTSIWCFGFWLLKQMCVMGDFIKLPLHCSSCHFCVLACFFVLFYFVCLLSLDAFTQLVLLCHYHRCYQLLVKEWRYYCFGDFEIILFSKFSQIFSLLTIPTIPSVASFSKLRAVCIKADKIFIYSNTFLRLHMLLLL